MNLLDFLHSSGIPAIVLITAGLILLISQIVGELIELCGKTAPTILKIRKWVKAKYDAKKERDQQAKDVAQTLLDIKEQQKRVETLLCESAKQNAQNIEVIQEFNKHYSPDSISQRDRWMLDVNCKMKWIDERVKVYDRSVSELTDLADVVKHQSDLLNINNKMTSELYKQATRTQILDFSHRLVNARKADKPVIFSREEFKKIRKSYEAYEKFLETYGGTNGEVDDAMTIVRDAQAGNLPNIEFLEDLRD